ncbi:MAG: DNA-directed DNA polymerase [Candidatus Aenigmatarchaeota archaeon]
MKKKLLLLDADYTVIENKTTVRLYCKDSKGKSFLVLDQTFYPYFYVMPKKDKIGEVKKKIETIDTKHLETKILKIIVTEKKLQLGDIKILKVVIDNPRKIQEIRKIVKDWEDVEETYEYDIPLYKRYLIDRQIEPMNWIEVDGEEMENKENYKVSCIIKANSVKPIKREKDVKLNVLAFDIEFIEENGKSKIIMLSLVSNKGKKIVLTSEHWENQPDYVESIKSEKEIIERFLEIVEEEDPDFICTYNGDNFDFPKLKERADELKIPIKLGRDNSTINLVRRGRVSSTKIKGRVHMDLFNFVDHILSANLKSEVLTLNEVAQELLGIGKKELKYKEMVEIWSKKKEMERLAEYSLHDSVLTFKLSELILPQIFTLSRLTGLLAFDVCRNTYSQLVEAFYMRKAFIDNVIIPNRPKTEEIEKRKMDRAYKGAIVIEPKKGIHSDILVFDFRSLYPTIIVTHNISPETLNCEHIECKEKNKVPETKWHFCIKNKGFIPKHLEELIEKRKKIKEQIKKIEKNSKELKKLNNMQHGLKILSNAVYGYFGFFGSRWYRRECGAAVAAFGRYYITQVIEMAKREGFEVIYADTDSCFATIG